MKRLSLSTVNWAKVSETLPKFLTQEFKDHKNRMDALTGKLQSLPADLPKIDWDAYRKVVPVAGMVDKFKQEYESYKVPEPVDANNWSEIVTEEERALNDSFKNVNAALNEYEKAINDYDEAYKLLPEPIEFATREIMLAYLPHMKKYYDFYDVREGYTKENYDTQDAYIAEQQKIPFIRYIDEEYEEEMMRLEQMEQKKVSAKEEPKKIDAPKKK